MAATFTQPPTLGRPGPQTFTTADPQALAEYLISNGYDAEPARARTEFTRLWAKGSLIVLYHSGTALVQGSNPGPAITLLESLIDATGGA